MPFCWHPIQNIHQMDKNHVSTIKRSILNLDHFTSQPGKGLPLDLTLAPPFKNCQLFWWCRPFWKCYSMISFFLQLIRYILHKPFMAGTSPTKSLAEPILWPHQRVLHQVALGEQFYEQKGCIEWGPQDVGSLALVIHAYHIHPKKSLQKLKLQDYKSSTSLRSIMVCPCILSSAFSAS